ncbi:DAHL domain-containing protein [Stieleria varia]|uniref:histidine kinase n=1 Tax=Stieleria varia TaxID=2528005 RepID=A0A5C6B652_9BACT|nr:DAHL domain-containing protein [Stieleria varia]TWU07765.1 Sensor histidine kinase TmoS [Stieleria varia]
MITRVLTSTLIAGFLVVIALLFFRSADNGANEFAAAEKAARNINELNSRLDQAVLKLRLGIVNDYDELARHEQELVDSLFSQSSDDLDSGANSLIDETFRPLVSQKCTLVGDFKADHAIVRNSTAGFQRYTQKTMDELGHIQSVASRLSTLGTHGSRFVISGSTDDRDAFEKVISECEDMARTGDGGELQRNESLSLALKHATKLVERRLGLDDSIEALIAIPVRETALQFLNDVAQKRDSKAASATLYRSGLLICIVVLIASCIFQYVLVFRQRAQLFKANLELDEQVAERTAGLTAANEMLAMQKEEAQKMALVARFTDNAVIIADADSAVEWVNVGFTQIFGYELNEVAGKRLDEFLHGQNSSTQQHSELKACVDCCEPFNASMINYTKDNLPIWVDIEARPIRNDHGQVHRYIAIISDITERIEAQCENEKLHADLVDASRQAGMAEIATGVLHNVGNILNSVNVSASVIRRQFSKSALANLEKVSQLIAEHETKFDEFVRDDERGRKVPAYVRKVTDALCGEREKLNQEFDELVKNVEHIKEIVSMQQSMAKSSGLIQELDARDLIRESLSANKGALASHRIPIEELVADSVPLFWSDKHRILQILINLIKNAKDAINEQRGDHPCIKVSATSDDQFVVFRVSDNGIGIPADKRDKIFQHGFTTKKAGHGFGLHSSANAATEMGGKLTVHSDGVGTGATFDLRVPFKPIDANHKPTQLMETVL